MNEATYVKSSVQSQVADGIRKYVNSRWPIYNVFNKGRWVINGTRIGQIAEIKKKKVEVMEWKLVDRVFVVHKRKKWKKSNLQETTVTINDKHTKILNITPITTTHYTTLEQESDEEGGEMETTSKINEGLWHLRPGGEYYGWLMDRANDDTQVLHGASDGSVKDCHSGGTYAWALLNKVGEVYEPTGAEAVGWENMEDDKLPTQEAHSYRMEAIGLLSALMFLRT